MRQDAAPGTYVLVMELEQATRLTIGRLQTCSLAAGYYLYVGSALNGLRSRVARHLRSEKRLHWHIDYLLQAARVVEVWSRQGPERLECAWAEALRRSDRVAPVVRGFGASDCGCGGHLFYSTERPGSGLIADEVDVTAGGPRSEDLQPRDPEL